MMKAGLLGRSILKSRSPWLHEQEARAQGVPLRYELVDFDERRWGDDALGGVVDQLRDDGYAGFNVTYPFKQQVMPFLDALDEDARTVGAVNTVAIRDGRLLGGNTDMGGFRQSMVEQLPDATLDRVLQLGAGGAGAAVASALLSLGVDRLVIGDVDAGRAAALADRLAARFGAGRVSGAAAADAATVAVDGIVNATPVGLASNPGLPIAADRVEARHWVADIVYFPLETELLTLARARGCRTLNGSGMVINQAATAFEIITGLTADRARMQRSFFA